MIGVSGLTVNFGDRFLFNDVSFLINPQDRIGLVGKNGAGKSTLLKVLAGLYNPDKGVVAYPQGFVLGYLPQDMDFEGGKTVMEETKTVYKEALALEDALEKINQELSTREDYESQSYMDLLDRLNDLNERMNLIGGFTLEQDIEKVLLGLGFTKSDFSRLTDEFSGGWRMRIELAKILLQQSNLLLLDEPTNHLDIESIQWLEEFLKTYSGSVVLISHDRAFLDNCTNRTIEISLGKVYDYKAPYTRYTELRAERRKQQIASYENQQKQIKDTEKFIERFRSKASKAVQVQSRIKQLEKIDVIEIDLEDTQAMRFRFPEAPRSGKVVVEAKDVTKSYDHTIFSKVNFYIERGDRVAFVGKNGQGKSTMSKAIVGEINYQGELKIGHNVNVGYYAQDQADTLDKNKTVFQVVDEAAHGEIRKHVRNLLGSFMFGGEEIDKKVGVLSGGERARVALCKLLLEPYNLLVLDEPTNHLDLRSKEILKEALNKYDGTLIVVSHDRDFLAGLTDKVLEFRNGNVKEYFGDVYEFLKTRKVSSFSEIERAKPVELAPKKEEKASSENKASYEEKKDQKRLKNKLSRLEQTIHEKEGRVEKLNELMLDPSKFTNAVLEEYNSTKKELESAMAEWEELSLQIGD